MIMKYIIDEKLATSILNYLIKKPYIEVKHMADGLQALHPYDDNAKQGELPEDVCTSCQETKSSKPNNKTK